MALRRRRPAARASTTACRSAVVSYGGEGRHLGEVVMQEGTGEVVQQLVVCLALALFEVRRRSFRADKETCAGSAARGGCVLQWRCRI